MDSGAAKRVPMALMLVGRRKSCDGVEVDEGPVDGAPYLRGTSGLRRAQDRR